MKICTFYRKDQKRLGIVSGGEVIDTEVAGAGKAPADMIAFIKGGADAIELADDLISDAPQSARHQLDSIKLAPPVVPSTTLCAGSNYQAHNAEKRNTPLTGKEPEFFVKTSDCVIGPEDGIICDTKLTSKLDLETELAIVIGKPGRHIPVQSALEHVFGYTVANDVTARDLQVRSTPEGFTWYELGRGKAFDTSLPLGPVIVTADEITNPQNLTLRTRINGELRQQTSTGDMIWTCAQLIHFFSTNFTLKPGMVILTGTPAGTAWSSDKELGGKWTPAEGLIAATRYCLPGDVVESEIVGIGVLRNPVIAS